MEKKIAKVKSLAIDDRTNFDSKTKVTVLTAAALVLLSLVAAKAFGQQPQPAVQANKKEYLGPAGDTIRPYVPANKDPFKKMVKPPVKPGAPNAKPKEPRPVGFPTLEERRAKYKQLSDEYADKGRPEPNPVMQYLVSELEIIGVFRDDLGFGAFIRAAPTGSTFFIRRGSRCYNGEILRIESDTSDSGAKVTFRQETYQINPDGKQIKLENVVAKQPGTAAKTN